MAGQTVNSTFSSASVNPVTAPASSAKTPSSPTAQQELLSDAEIKVGLAGGVHEGIYGLALWCRRQREKAQAGKEKVS